ncbi:MAG: helix-turn-helix transcriptional regulator, partial [Clostridia bacterium]|nr:helix-turn-helix transcriptional regulator [Clostridia bacterium]
TAFENKPKISGGRFTDNRLIDYINRNLYEDITLEDISKKVHLSVSQMNRNFKKLTGSTVHNYIISKRLIAAQIMINEGKSAAEACHLSGFKDYSSFFRIYKKRFGTAPTSVSKAVPDSKKPYKMVFMG